MLELLVRNGSVVTPAGVHLLDIGIVNGRIAVLRASGTEPNEAAERAIDASGMIVVPGGIDPHVHTNWVVPTAAETGIRCFGPDRVSKAAAYGGTTTLADFAIWKPGESLSQTFDRKMQDWRGTSYVDYALHGTFNQPEIPFEILAEVPDAVSDGHATYKVWMTNTTPTRPWQKTDVGHIWALLQKTAASKAMLCVHAEDDDIVMYAYKRLEHEGRTSLEHIAEAHNSLSERLSFERIIALAEHVGAPIYLMHVSALSGIEAIREARAKGQPVYGESLQHYAYFTEDSYRQPNGAIYHTYPSLKTAGDRDAMWAALVDGSLSTVATDEMCTDLATKLRGKTIFDVTGGHAGVEVRMAIAYTEGVHRRGMSLQRYVDITSGNAARILGVYPQKGIIAVGSDADLVLLETGIARPIVANDLHETDYTPWEGYITAAWPQTTILRGVVLVSKGKMTESRPSGLLLRQALSADVFRRPAC